MLKHLKKFSWVPTADRESLKEKVARARRDLVESSEGLVGNLHRNRLEDAENALAAFDPSQTRWWIYGDKGQFTEREWTAQEYEALVALARDTPCELADSSDSKWWFFRDRFYKADADLAPDDVAALALEAENRKRLKLEKAHALQAMRETLDSKAKRQPIPQDVKVVVWQRDAGRCTECGSQENLEYDHIIPLALGGSNTDRNLQLLCETCNRRKGATLG